MFFQTLSNRDILDSLKGIDHELSLKGKKATIIITGGSALSLLTNGSRVTTDIDYLGSLPLSDEKITDLYLSNDVEGILVVPDISEMSFDLTYQFENLTVYVLSWEDLAIMKFYSSRSKDYQDLVDYILPHIYDFSRLRTRLDYYKADYIFDLDNPDLNLNNWVPLLEEIKSKYKIVVLPPTLSVEKALKSTRSYSKFLRTPVPRLQKEPFLGMPLGEALAIKGVRELLLSVTFFDFRV